MMSATNCPNCGAPYLTKGASCDYCGTPKQFDETEVSYNVVYADNKPYAVFMDPAPIGQLLETRINGDLFNRNRGLIHDCG